VATVSTTDTDRIRLHLLAGASLTADLQLSDRLRRAVAVATEVGAPLLAAVEAAAEAEDDDARAVRAVAVSTAQARTVARGLSLAPLVLVPVIGRLAGVDVLAFYREGVGLAILLAGLVLLATGALLARLIIARAGRRDHDADLEEVAELVASALSGGSGSAAALRAVAGIVPHHARHLQQLALDIDLGIHRPASGGESQALVRLREVLMTAVEVGAPAAPTLRHLARDLRADELARLMAAAERLPAQLTVPTTLLLLPVTLLLVGAPLVASGLARVLA
jgi:Flp pilus assembly protein TadB